MVRAPIGPIGLTAHLFPGSQFRTPDVPVQTADWISATANRSRNKLLTIWLEILCECFALTGVVAEVSSAQADRV